MKIIFTICSNNYLAQAKALGDSVLQTNPDYTFFIGLVDELGTINDALTFAAQKANLKTYSVTNYPKKISKFEQLFKDMSEDEISARIIKNKIGLDNYKIFEQITNPKLQSSVMMEMPYHIKFD